MVWFRTIIHAIINSLFPWRMCFIPSMFKFNFLSLLNSHPKKIVRSSFLVFCTVSVAIKFSFLQLQEHFLSAKVSWIKVVIVSKNRFTNKRSEKKVKILHIITCTCILHSVRSTEKHSDIKFSFHYPLLDI